MSGVKLSPLGSSRDKVMRDYLSKRSFKEVQKHRVVALAAVATANMSKTPQETVTDILKSFSTYVGMEMFLDRMVEDTEQLMKDEYEFWRKVRPKVNISKDGKSAALSMASLKPKS